MGLTSAGFSFVHRQSDNLGRGAVAEISPGFEHFVAPLDELVVLVDALDLASICVVQDIDQLVIEVVGVSF